ncbi:chalcone isomerase family protein [Pseudomonas sp. TUM22785]|uniref:chalcone isomerase family protein n=1 Tax=Pseudomonas sp. TUM22785 TaxID=3019098 RepID=UPI002306C1FD|nr:chalcone isomerase family protein [Pseudomonas sp. TUM22785]WCD78181.1 chalcone isomerase family protein [Pseudomonas sp. TUM22785]
MTIRSFSPRHLLVVAFIGLLGLQQALADGWREAVPDAQVVGSGEFSAYGFHIYDARLWAPGAVLGEDRPFALELVYQRTISRDTLVEASLDDLQRLGGEAVDAARLGAWQAEMERAFVDVEPGQRITGVYLPGVGGRLYVEGRAPYEVRDPLFARTFFGIWLDPRTQDPELRLQLLGGLRSPFEPGTAVVTGCCPVQP